VVGVVESFPKGRVNAQILAGRESVEDFWKVVMLDFQLPGGEMELWGLRSSIPNREMRHRFSIL
jgi:hypothetical protein